MRYADAYKASNNVVIQNYFNHKPVGGEGKQRKEQDESSESMHSADCDEKRSFTPEPSGSFLDISGANKMEQMRK